MIIARGTIMIGVLLVGDDSIYILGSEKAFFCCGEHKVIPELFSSVEDANGMIQTIKVGATDGEGLCLKLLDLSNQVEFVNPE
jgi:hypothetical protein